MCGLLKYPDQLTLSTILQPCTYTALMPSLPVPALQLAMVRTVIDGLVDEFVDDTIPVDELKVRWPLVTLTVCHRLHSWQGKFRAYPGWRCVL